MARTTSGATATSYSSQLTDGAVDAEPVDAAARLHVDTLHASSESVSHNFSSRARSSKRS